MSKTTKEFSENPNKEFLDNSRKYGIKKLKIIGAKDACLSCKEHIGKEYLIDEAPIIPNPECTKSIKGVGKSKKWREENVNKYGGWCKCTYLQVIPKKYEPSDEWKNSVKGSSFVKEREGADKEIFIGITAIIIIGLGLSGFFVLLFLIFN